MRKILKVLLIFPVAVYGLYVVAISLFLNTPIFAKTLEMTDTSKTHLRVDGAWSLLPGTIRASTIHVLIREPDVELDVELHHPTIRFDFRGLFHKQAHMPLLHVEETTVAVRTKSTPPTPDPEAKLPPEVRELHIDIAEREKLARRWTIIVDRVELPNVTRITMEKTELLGKMAIEGAFLLQPGTRCEIYPSTFTITDGKISDGISDIQFASQVRFHRFYKSHLTGSEVLHYVDAHFEGTAKATGLQSLNVTLRSLGDYGFGEGAANLRTNLDIKAGKIQAGSEFHADKSVIRLSGPRFDVVGNGEIAWRANADDSTLHAEVSDAKTVVNVGKNKMTGSVRKLTADAKIIGLELASAFSGLSGRVRVRGGEVRTAPLGTSAEGFAYYAKARIGGELTAVTGSYPDRAGLPKPSAFTVDIDESAARVPSIGTVVGNGRIALSVKTIDFRHGRVELPTLLVNYRGEIDSKYPLDLTWSSTDASRIFGLKDPADDHWRGSGELKLAEFNGILDYLRETKRISAIVRAGLNATEMRTAVSWDVTPLDSRLEIHELDSNGIWSGFGTLVSEKSEVDGPAEVNGQFRGKVLGLPLGVGLAGKSVQVKLFPGKGPVETTKQ